LAEMSGDAREPLLQIPVDGQPLPINAAQIAGDDFRAGLVQQKTSAIEELHQRAGTGEAAFSKQHQAPAGLQISRYPPQRGGRSVVDEKRAAVDRNFAMQPTRLCRDTGDHEPPVLIQADADKKPVDERLMVWNEQHRSRRLQHGLGVRPKAEEPSHQQAKQDFHSLEILPSSVFAETQRMIAAVTKTDSGASQ